MKRISPTINVLGKPWKMWHGGDCPVQQNLDVHIIVRSGNEFKFKASDVSWDHRDVTDMWHDTDVVMYRVA
jgi:hypothetical protein